MSVISQTVRPSSTPDILVSYIHCDLSVVVGDWVRLNEQGVAIKAVADSFDNSTIFGLVEERGSGTNCVIRVAGISKELFTGLNITKPYFLDTLNPGLMSLSVPTSPGQIVLSLGRPISDKRFLVQPSLRLQRS